MMRSIVCLLLFLMGSGVFAQKANFEACVKFSEKNLSDYVHSLSVYPSWIGNSDFFWYYYTTSDGTVYYLVDAGKGKKQKLFSTERLAAKLAELTGKTENVRDFKLGGVRFEGDNPYRLMFSKYGKDFEYDVKRDVLKEYSRESKGNSFSRIPYWQRWSPDSNYMVYAYKHNVYLQERGDTISYQLTTDGERYYSYSFQRDKDTDKREGASITWSGDSKVFYALRQDRRNVGEGYLIDHLAEPRPTLKTYKFPMPGEKYVYTYDLHLFHAEKRSHQVVDIAKYPDQEVKIILFDFNKYPEYIYFTRKSRTCDEMDLCRVDTRTGEVFEIIHERCEPHFTEQLFECRILNGGEDILWWSERSGWGQYYLYNKDGQLKNPVTTGDFVAGRIMEMDTLGRSFVFEGYGREKGINPEYRLFYKVNFDGSDLTLLTPGDGFHSIDLAKNGKYLIDNYSRADQEPIAELRNMKGKKIMELERPDLRLLYEMGWKKPERIRVKAADGMTDLYGVMYRPFDMDTTRKYPIIVNVYPGPQENFVPQSFTLDDNGNESLAQLGFIVVNVGFRGSCFTRGRNYHCFGYGNLRDYALADCKFVVEQLANRYSFIDLDRVGIYGHSGGGFMAAASILTYPDFYKVAVAASGNHDNNIYTKWWGETYHGVKMHEKRVGKQDSVVYSFESKIPTTIELAKNLKGKLLLITGDMDINVHMAHTIRLANALMQANKRFDLMLIPGADHGLGSPYYVNLIRYYFVENLLGQRLNSVDMDKVD